METLDLRNLYFYLHSAEATIWDLLQDNPNLEARIRKCLHYEQEVLELLENDGFIFCLTPDPWRFTLYREYKGTTYSGGYYDALEEVKHLFRDTSEAYVHARLCVTNLLKNLSKKQTAEKLMHVFLNKNKA